MRFFSSVGGMLHLEITGADPGQTLERLSSRGVVLEDIRWKDDLTVRFQCRRRDRNVITGLCRKQGDEVRFLGETGILYLTKKVLSRPALAAGIIILMLLTILLPTRVLFFRVEGNRTVPDRKILESAEDCGLRFGVSRKLVRSEKIKNQLLERIPELKWAGINTSGCTALIAVREQQREPQKTVSTGVSSIMAVRDGRITACTVTRGNGLCVPGQVVQEGQLLISGYTDCGLCIQVTEAQGEVFAETRRKQQTVTPAEHLLRQETVRTQKIISLVIGKKRINFWKGSGISPVTCGRMYEEYYITLPGGFRLPVCLRVETLTDWNVTAQELPPEAVDAAMKAFSRKSVLDSSIAGSILQETQNLYTEKGRHILDSSFFCSEMIGRVIMEEIGETNGKTD